MKCPACATPNRPGALRCKGCSTALPRSCPGCGEALAEGVDLCVNCRTERIPAALGAELLEASRAPVPPSTPTSSTLLGSDPPFVGRQATLARLMAIVDRCLEPAQLQFAALIGAAGSGKSRVALEVARRIAERLPEARVLTSVCGGPSAPPFAAVQRLFCERFGIAETDPPELARRKLSAGVSERLSGSRATEVTHLLAQLIRYPFPDSPVVAPLAETPAQLESRTFIAARRFLEIDAAKHPLIFILDDIHRASAETVNLIHYLAAGLASSRVCILVIGRDSLFEAHPTFGEGDAPLERMELGPLDPEESAALFRAHLPIPAEPPEDLIAHARDKLGGSPRALLELVRYLVEVGALGPDRADPAQRSFDGERLRYLSLPADLEAIIGERLRVMEAGERDLLEKAAGCGEAFWLDALVALVRSSALERGDPDGPTLGEVAAAGDRTRSEVERTLRALVERDLIVAQGHCSIPGEREYRFAYPPWRDVVYAGIDAAARRRYHRLIAQWLELRPDGRGEEQQEEIARHLERAGEGGGAAVHYRRAADAARLRYYNDKAVRLYAAALGCLGPGDLASRIHLWHDLGSVFQLKGDFDAAIGAFERMLRLAWMVASRTKAAVAFNKMGRIYRQKGDLPLALEYLERGHDLFEQADDVRGVAGSLDDIGQVLWLLSRYDEALDRSAAALETRRRLGDKRSVAVSLMNIGNIERHRGLFEEAEACYREALELRTALGDRAGIAQGRNGLGVLAFQRGDVEAARREWEGALSLAESIGALPLQALLLNHLGEAARVVGQRGEARTRFDATEVLARDLDDRRLLSEALYNLGLLDLAEGDTARALERCDQSLAIADAAGIRVDVGRALLALGEVHAMTLFDDADSGRNQADEYFQRGVELFREIGNEAELAIGLERFGKFRIERGEVEAGRRLLGEAQEIFDRLGMRAGDAVKRVIHDL